MEREFVSSLWMWPNLLMFGYFPKFFLKMECTVGEKTQNKRT